MKSKKLFLLAALSTLALVGCNQNNQGGSSSSYEEPPEDDEVNVFVLSGQSNMEGSTYWKHKNGTPLLEQYFETRDDLDFAELEAGLETVQTSYYGFYYPNKWGRANSSSEDKSSPEGLMQPNFLPTTVGMGVADNPGLMMGPEVGISYTLREYGTSDKPIFLIKCAFSGSGFEKMDGPNWNSREEDPDKSLFYLLKTYVNGCLENLEDQGYVPVMKGFLWHQGESDGGNSKYRQYTETLVGDFRSEYEDYARDQDKDNIAFIDCTIYDGKKLSYGTAANEAKMAIANESEDDLNFCINASTKDPDGLNLEIGDDAKGGYGTYHYNTDDAYRLGEAYANIIIDNGILDI